MARDPVLIIINFGQKKFAPPPRDLSFAPLIWIKVMYIQAI